MGDNLTKRSIREIYAILPKLNCAGKCQEACGPIICSDAEREAIEMATHRKLTHCKSTGVCRMLKNGKCLGYENRPLVCRLFGLVPKMRCPFGCEPERWLTDQEGFDLLEEMAQGEPMKVPW